MVVLVSSQVETKTVIFSKIRFYQNVLFKQLFLKWLVGGFGRILEKAVDHFDRVFGWKIILGFLLGLGFFDGLRGPRLAALRPF